MSYRQRINGMWRQTNTKQVTKIVNERKKYQGVGEKVHLIA